LDDLEFTSQQRKESFLFSILSRIAVRPTQPPVPWVFVILSQELKRLGSDTDDSLLSRAKDKNV